MTAIVVPLRVDLDRDTSRLATNLTEAMSSPHGCRPESPGPVSPAYPSSSPKTVVALRAAEGGAAGVPVRVVLGCTGSITGARGLWLKSKSLMRLPRMRSFSRTSASGRVGRRVRGSMRWPLRKSSSMNLS